jgi:predicted kinase
MGFLQPHVGYGRCDGKAEVSQPLLILVGGFSGSGKSTLGECLSNSLPNTAFIDSDRLRKEIFGVPMTQKLPPEAYADEVSIKIYAEMLSRTEKILRDGQNAVVSATFTFASSQKEYEDLAARQGARFQGFWLKTDTKTLLDRVTARKNDASDADASIVTLQVTSDVSIPRQTSWAIIDASQTPAEVLQQAWDILRSERPHDTSISP